MTIRIRRSLKGCFLLVLLFGMIGANGKCDLAMRIWADLQQQIDDNQEQIDSQQQQIDQLTGAVCELSVLTGNPTHPEFCEVVVTEICDFNESVACVCYPGDDFELESCEPVELQSCESASFPHPDFGVDPPPKCDTVNGCRGTFTRTAAGDVGSIEVDPNCAGGDGCSGCSRPCPPPDECPCGCDRQGNCDPFC